MSFSWKSLLGSGGQSSSTSTSTTQPSANTAAANLEDAINSWELRPEGMPPLLGMENVSARMNVERERIGGNNILKVRPLTSPSLRTPSRHPCLNSSYVNSVLQALYFCKPFRESILSYPADQLTSNTEIINNAPANIQNPSIEKTGGASTTTLPSGRGGRAAARPSTATSPTSPSAPFPISKQKQEPENSGSGHKRRASLGLGFSSARPPSSAGRPPKSPTLSSTSGEGSLKSQTATSTSTSTSPSTAPAISAPTAASTSQLQEQASLFSTLRDLFHLIHNSPSQTSNATSTNKPSQSALSPSASQKKSGGRPSTAGGRLGGAGNSTTSTSNSVLLSAVTALATGPLPVEAPVGAGTPHASQGGKNAATGKVPSDSVKKFWSALKKENVLFDSTQHQDAHEMLNFVLNKVGEDLVEEDKNNKKEFGSQERELQDLNQSNVHHVAAGGKTWVHRLFEGVLTNETRCLTCESVTSRDEAFLDLSIDIVQNSSVSSCLRQFSASEMLCSKNKFFCDTCSGLQEAEKRMKIKKLPNVLALHLKRFKYEEQVQRFVKLAYRVVFPFELRLFNTSDDAENPDRLYELFGIVIHVGVGYHHGHYVTIVKVGGRWVVFDDTNVGFIEEADIARYFGDSPGSGSAYVLFYQAVDLDYENLGLARPVPAYETATTAPFEPGSAPVNPLETSAPIRVASPAAMDISPSKVNTSLPLSSPPNGLSSSSSSLAGGGGLFGKRQGSTSGPGLTNEEKMDSEKLSSGGGWFGTFRGRERRATASSSGGLPSSPSSEALSAQAPPSSYRPRVATNSAAGSAVGEGDDGLSASSRTTDSAQADKFSPQGSGFASTPASSAPPQAQVRSESPVELPAEELTPQPAPASTSTYQNGLETIRPSANAGTSVPSESNPFEPVDDFNPRNNVGIGSPSQGQSSRFVSAPVTSSASPQRQTTSLGSAAGAAFAPADRPLTRKEQEKIAKNRRRASAHVSSGPPNHSNLPPSPSIGNAGASDEGLGHFTPAPSKRQSMRRAFGFGKKS